MIAAPLPTCLPACLPPACACTSVRMRACTRGWHAIGSLLVQVNVVVRPHDDRCLTAQRGRGLHTRTQRQQPRGVHSLMHSYRPCSIITISIPTAPRGHHTVHAAMSTARMSHQHTAPSALQSWRVAASFFKQGAHALAFPAPRGFGCQPWAAIPPSSRCPLLRTVRYNPTQPMHECGSLLAWWMSRSGTTESCAPATISTGQATPGRARSGA